MDGGVNAPGGRLTDSPAFAHLWGSDEVRALFSPAAMYRGWLEILAAVAGAQAELGIIPVFAAEAIAATDPAGIDLDAVAAETRRTSHSTLGFITVLRRVLPSPAADHVSYGISVQDVTDTWTVLVLRDVAQVAWRDLHALEARLVDLALAHRDTVMAGRTHGQAGAPITFGLKAASWADEVRRHLQRLAEGRQRWLVGQLGAAVGTLGFFGAQGPRLRVLFCSRLGLGDPLIGWCSSRDRLAEFSNLLAMICGTLARIGAEVFELARPEINELRELPRPGTVGSITMPHKRNPEGAEHLDTLARLARANAGVVLEGIVAVHERDGRAWKAEWAAFPEVCLLTSAALRLALDLTTRLEVDASAMAANVAAARGFLSSEEVAARVATRMGGPAARAALQDLLADAQRRGRSLIEAVTEAGMLDAEEVGDIVAHPSLFSASAAVDGVAARAVRARAAESESWP